MLNASNQAGCSGLYLKDGFTPTLDQRPIGSGDPRRWTLWSRLLRHERVHRSGARFATRHPAARAARAASFRIFVRRGTGLSRRTLAARRARETRHAPHRRAQRQQRVPMLRERQIRAFVAHAERRERYRIRGAADLPHSRPRPTYCAATARSIALSTFRL